MVCRAGEDDLFIHGHRAAAPWRSSHRCLRCQPVGRPPGARQGLPLHRGHTAENGDDLGVERRRRGLEVAARVRGHSGDRRSPARARIARFGNGRQRARRRKPNSATSRGSRRCGPQRCRSTRHRLSTPTCSLDLRRRGRRRRWPVPPTRARGEDHERESRRWARRVRLAGEGDLASASTPIRVLSRRR